MRVLHVYTGNLFGGIETALATLARCRNICPDIEHHFALCYPGRLSDELKSHTALVYDLGRVRARNVFLVRRARSRLAEIMRDQKIEVGICHGVWSQVVFGRVIQRSGAGQVFWQHDPATGRGWLERMATFVPPTLVVSNSQYSQSTLGNLYSKVPRTVLFYPVEPPTHSEPSLRRTIRAELNTPLDTLVDVQVSRLEPRKGHESHLKALSQLKDVSNWECWMVGGPQRPHEMSYFSHLKQLTGTLRIENRVRFLGQRHDARQLMAAADIFCQPNIGPEPFGLTFIEALGTGLPVVTSELGGAGEIVDDSCGVLVRPGDVGQLANVLRSLICDADKRMGLGVAGPLRAAALCDPRRQLTRMADVLLTVKSDGSSLTNNQHGTAVPSNQIEQEGIVSGELQKSSSLSDAKAFLSNLLP